METTKLRINGVVKTVESSTALTDADIAELGGERVVDQPAPEPESTPWTRAKSLGRAALGVADVGQSLVTSAVAGLAGQAVGAGRVVTGQLGLHGSESLDTSLNKGADAVRSVGDMGTPVYSDAGKAIMKPVGEAFQAVNKFGGDVGEASGAVFGPKAAAAGRTIGENALEIGASAIGGKGLVKSVLSGVAQPLSHIQTSIKPLQDAGFRVDPSVSSPGVVNSLVVKGSDEGLLQGRLANYNASVVDRIAREEAKLPADAFLNTDSIKKLKDTEGLAYEKIKAYKRPFSVDLEYQRAIRALDSDYALTKASFPGVVDVKKLERLRGGLFEPDKAHNGGLLDAATVVETAKLFRDEARDVLTNKAASPQARQLAFGKKKAANALEQLLERRLSQHPGIAQDLVTDFKAARTQLAKLHTIEDALNPMTGRVNPEIIAEQFKAGVPLSDGLRLIADAHQTMPRVVKNVEGKAPGRNWQPYAHVGVFGAAGHLMGGPAWGAAASIVPLAMRKAVDTGMYQNRLASVKPAIKRQFKMQDAMLAGAGAGAQEALADENPSARP